ncbi:MAG: 4-hydroxy-2-oxovalerate aldolase [Desulfobacterales bacterium]|nr:4-hydroxy-2-oxovalerate aldolase [Desulfobacterales bacterium]
MNRHNLEILECTLRDGSYTIDFQFTPRDTYVIAAALENAGFNLIEVGHGLGLNASSSGKGQAAATDEEYMKAAASTLKRAQWGMFFIPGIGQHEDLKLAADYGMDFVRIGTNVTEVEQSKEYIEHAKKLGMFVSANLMKSYALPPKELSIRAKLSERFGVDLVCLVDSAGTMLPEDIQNYVRTMQDVLNIPIGLHCHDNLALGIANVLAAIDCGVQRIDSTLQGMGRGGGNPATEVLVSVLKKQGIDLNIDLNRLMDVSERLIKPMLQEKGFDSINITSGYAGFHSGYLKTILKYADRYKVDPRDLIVEVCRADQVYAHEELVEDIASRLQQQEAGRAGLHIISLPHFAFADGKEMEASDDSLAGAVERVVTKARTTAKRRGKQSVLNIVAAPQAAEQTIVSRFVQEEFDYVIGSVEVGSPLPLEEIIAVADGVVDILLVDAELKPYLNEPLFTKGRSLAKQSRVVGYKDYDVWVRSVDQDIRMMLKDIRGRQITVCGTDNLSLKLVLSMLEQGARVTLTGATSDKLEVFGDSLKRMALCTGFLGIEADPVEAARAAEVMVSFSRRELLVSRAMVEVMAAHGIIFDGGIGSVPPEVIAYCNECGMRIIRPDMRAVLACELASLLGTDRTVNELMGRGEIAGVQVVAGGLVGKYGDIVVDSVSNPSRVVGVADGCGRVLYVPTEFTDQIEAVEREIVRRQALII